LITNQITGRKIDGDAGFVFLDRDDLVSAGRVPGRLALSAVA
jgi:hypothetical protein